MRLHLNFYDFDKLFSHKQQVSDSMPKKEKKKKKKKKEKREIKKNEIKNYEVKKFGSTDYF